MGVSVFVYVYVANQFYFIRQGCFFRFQFTNVIPTSTSFNVSHDNEISKANNHYKEEIHRAVKTTTN